VVRHLELPRRTRVIAIGGATLGGSGKTPLAIACAAELATKGARVALVGHAYRAKPRRARVVRIDDALREVGDEALLAARVLASAGVRVVVAPRRSEAVMLAARDADVLVLDGIAQTSPMRATLALLAVDAMEPWGRGHAVAPRGDLRAPKAALLRACDGVVSIADGYGAGVDIAGESPHESGPALGPWHGWMASSGVQVGETMRTWDDIAGLRVGLLCAMARPERLIRSIERRGIALRALVRARDHGPVAASDFVRAARAARAGSGIDLWLATPKCCLHFTQPGTDVGNILQAPIAAIEHTVVLSSALIRRLDLLAVP
jgi:tetraacyldisaccharide 4'-kinase